VHFGGDECTLLRVVSSRSALYVVGAALLASVGANLWLVAGPGHTPVSDERGSSPVRTTPTDAPAAYRTDELIECRGRLDLCERRRKLGPLAFRPGPDRTAREDDDPGDPRDKREFLCDLARTQVQEQWIDRQPEIVFVLRNTLVNDAVQEQDTLAAVERFAEGLGLSDADRERFTERYREARLSRIDSIHAALDVEPPNFERILEQIQALHADEDRIAAEMFGNDAERRLRETEREKRAALLAIAATYADVPWEDVID
jgi:hypothetical protein